MLEPRETDLPALFLVLVVLPIIAYILLGKWSEASKKNDRISLLAELAAEEALRTETMATASVIPVIPIIPSVPVIQKNLIHVCARCSVPATTRCSRCKSVRYCSGKCQIIHWRQVHKHECQQLQNDSCSSSPMASLNGESTYQRPLLNDEMNIQSAKHNEKQSEHQSDINGSTANRGHTTSEGSGVAAMERRSTERRVSRKSKSRREDEDANTRHKMKNTVSEPVQEAISRKQSGSCTGLSNQHTTRSMKHENHDFQSQHDRYIDSARENGVGESSSKDDDAVYCPPDMASIKRAVKSKSSSHSNGTKVHKLQKSVKASIEQAHTGLGSSEPIADEPSRVSFDIANFSEPNYLCELEKREDKV